MATTVASRKAKGRKLQQMVRDAVLDAFPDLQPDDVRSTPMGSAGEDLMLSPLARKAFPFGVECKNQEKLNIHESLAQAEKNCRQDCSPLLIFKRNHSKTYACVDLDTFIKLVQDAAR